MMSPASKAVLMQVLSMAIEEMDEVLDGDMSRPALAHGQMVITVASALLGGAEPAACDALSAALLPFVEMARSR